MTCYALLCYAKHRKAEQGSAMHGTSRQGLVCKFTMHGRVRLSSAWQGIASQSYAELGKVWHNKARIRL